MDEGEAPFTLWATVDGINSDVHASNHTPITLERVAGGSSECPRWATYCIYVAPFTIRYVDPDQDVWDLEIDEMWWPYAPWLVLEVRARVEHRKSVLGGRPQDRRSGRRSPPYPSRPTSAVRADAWSVARLPPTWRGRVSAAVTMTLRELTGLLRSTLAAFEADDAPLLSGAIAFYTLLSMAPLVLLAVWLVGLVFGEAETLAWVVATLGKTWGMEAATVAAGMIERIRIGSGNPIGFVLGGAILLYGATKVFVSLQAALNTIWNVREKPRVTLRGRVQGLLRKRLMSFVMIVGVGATLMCSMVIRAGLHTFHRLSEDLFPFASVAWRFVDLLVGLSLVTALFTLIFRVLPDAKIQWKITVLGAAITAAMFNFGSYLISFYFAYAGTATVQGAAGSVIAILLWVYFSAHVFFLGAELTGLLAETYGDGIRPDPHAERFERITTRDLEDQASTSDDDHP